MGDVNFLKEMGVSEAVIDDEINNLFKNFPVESLPKLYEKSIKEFKPNSILKGKIVNILTNEVIIDIGYKSEGIIPLKEFDNPDELKIGNEIEVLLEAIEDDSEMVIISKNKADHIRGWEKIISSYKEGDSVKGRVLRKIKGGLLVNIGAPAFLPLSQVDIRRLDDIGRLVGKEIEAKILKIDPERMNIIISRRKFMEDKRLVERTKLLAELQVGDVKEGVVKNIADFGVFVDIGGIDGLLHITDMAWQRVSHPSEIVTLDQTIKVKILKIDPATGRIAIGFKQLTPNPWEKVEQKYAIGNHVKGKVVNLVQYGAFIQLESGVEGLLHISEMSWTKRITHPSDMLAIGDIIEAVVLKVSSEKHELSLGIKQLELNPWTQIEGKYPPGTRIQGRVRNLTTYGAFIEIEEGIDGLLHLSDMSWMKKAAKPAELVNKGDKIEAVVLSVDPEKKKVSLGLKQLTPNPWETIIPEKYKEGSIVKGKVIKLTKFGALVELEPNIEGTMRKFAAPLPAEGEASPKEGGAETDPEGTATEPPKTVAISEKIPEESAYQPKPDDEITVEVTKLEPAEGKITLKLVKPPEPTGKEHSA